MKKKIIVIGSVLAIVIAAVLLILLRNNDVYTIKVSVIDDRSPDRLLTVYNNKNEKIEVKRIEYLDGTFLCNGYNLTVNFGDIKNVKELKVILKDKSEKTAKIVDKEVK